MAIKNKWLAEQQVKKEVEIRLATDRARLYTAQQCKDMMLIAAADAFGFGAERLKRLGDAFDSAFTSYAVMVMEDTQDIEYSKAKIDQKLQAACGEYFEPWEVRYGEARDE